ncbi:Mss4-like protein [Lineolata rhizophorae]|uniref:Mss4-like protein n=1 Tax=Lineolata rhizophorae TaxID=578093 RepID=A0A6A6NMG0_9PEZI|nr:Mss4-like protein [Lineolata rhizophorae]
MSSGGESGVYDGNCHCGAVRYTVKLSPPLPEYVVTQCNCSVCTKIGYLLVYPSIDDFTSTRGEDQLKEYRFGSKRRPHRMCGNCGCSILIDLSETGQNTYALNVRMFKDVDLDKFKYKYVDGKNLALPQYEI